MTKLFDKAASSVLLLSIAAFLISTVTYVNFGKFIPFLVCSLLYFIKTKKLIKFKNALIYSFIFACLRLATTISITYIHSKGYTDINMLLGIIRTLFDFFAAFIIFYIFNLFFLILYKCKTNKKLRFSVCTAIIILTIMFLITNYSYGHFSKGTKMNYPHTRFTSFQINEDEVLILGHKRPDSTKSIKEQMRVKDTDNQYDKHISLYNETPSEILDLNTGKFKEIKPKADFFYESEGVALDENKVLLTRVCKTDKTDDESLSYCYLNNMAAIWDVKNQNVDFIKTNCFDRRGSTIKKINNNEILISGGSYSIVLSNRKYTKKEMEYLRKKENEITLYDVQKNQCRAIIQPEDHGYLELTTSDNSIKLYKNEKFYNFDFNTKELSEIQPTQKDYVIYGTPEKTSEEIKEIKERLKQERYYSAYLHIPLTNNYILYFGGLTPGFSSLNVNNKAHIIDFKEKKVYKVPGLPWGTYGSNYAFLKNGNLIIFGGNRSRSSTQLLHQIIRETLIFKPGILIKNKRSKL